MISLRNWLALSFLILVFGTCNATGFEGIDWNRASLWLNKGDYVEAIPPGNAKKIKLEFKNE